MEIRKPLKRHTAIQPLSREHHHGLQLCWKIRTGFQRNVAVPRIWSYTGWFYRNFLLPHFDAEEKLLFPVLGDEHSYIRKAVAEHRRLKRLFEDNQQVQRSLNRIEEELEKHIRFEERVLFNEIQQAASEAQLLEIAQLHTGTVFPDTWEDRFWE